MRLAGRHGYTNLPSVGESKVTDAIIRNEGKEIVVDYEYDNRIGQLKLNSSDGIHFSGEYGDIRKIGDCEFILYKNAEGYFLFGGYSSAEDDTGLWWIELRHKGKEAV